MDGLDGVYMEVSGAWKTCGLENGVEGGRGAKQRKCIMIFFFFFKQKTAYEIVSRDWSSDVCSSDLI